MPEVTRTDYFDDQFYAKGEEVIATEERIWTFNGTTYKTYLTEENAELFDEEQRRWSENASVVQAPSKTVSKPSKPGTKSAETQQNQRIREWAKKQQVDPPINDRGRIPETIKTAYFKANPDDPRVSVA